MPCSASAALSNTTVQECIITSQIHSYHFISKLGVLPWLSPGCESVHGKLPGSSELQHITFSSGLSTIFLRTDDLDFFLKSTNMFIISAIRVPACYHTPAHTTSAFFCWLMDNWQRWYSRGMMPWSTSCSRVRLCWSLNCRTEKVKAKKKNYKRKAEACWL